MFIQCHVWLKVSTGNRVEILRLMALVFSHSIIVTWVLEAEQSENGIYIKLFTKLVSVSSPSYEPLESL